MRKQITHIGVIASRSANRIYDKSLKVFMDEIKQQEGKEVFASTVMLRTSADLFQSLGGDFEDQLDMLVSVMKEQAKAARLSG